MRIGGIYLYMKTASIMRHEQTEARESVPLRTSEMPGVEPAFSLWFAFQVLVSLIMVIITLPVQAVIGLIIAISTSFPIFYRGPRVGRGAQIFKLIKFRTLPDKYEYQVGGRLLTDKERNRGLFAKLIVRTKMDELPQLYNVIRGEMAFVGPRPVRPALYARYRQEIPHYGDKFSVRPGITGLAQIVGGYYMDPADKQHYDMLYLENKSVSLDIKIIILTVVALFLSRRIMKTNMVQKFLGFDLQMKESHVETSNDVMLKVTTDIGAPEETANGNGASHDPIANHPHGNGSMKEKEVRFKEA